MYHFLFFMVCKTLCGAVKKVVDKKEQAFLAKYDDELLDYCLQRELIICPSCRTAFHCTCIEEQLNTEWQCSCCGQKFEETPTHTIRRN